MAYTHPNPFVRAFGFEYGDATEAERIVGASDTSYNVAATAISPAPGHYPPISNEPHSFTVRVLDSFLKNAQQLLLTNDGLSSRQILTASYILTRLLVRLNHHTQLISRPTFY